MKATEQYFPMVLFIILYKVVLTFESVVELLKCDHSNESYWAVLSYAVQGGSKFLSLDVILKWDKFKWKLRYCFLHCRIKCVNWWSVVEILKCGHSNESYWAVLFCGAAYYTVLGSSKLLVCGWNPEVWPFKWKQLSSTFLWCCLLCCTRWF